jgi:hypothetical protein
MKLCIDILNKQKCIFSKMENRKIKQDLYGVDAVGGGENIRKRGRIWLKYYVLLSENGKMRAVETILRNGEGWIKNNYGWGEFN